MLWLVHVKMDGVVCCRELCHDGRGGEYFDRVEQEMRLRLLLFSFLGSFRLVMVIC